MTRWSLPDGRVLISLGPTKTVVMDQMRRDVPEGPFRALEDFALVDGEAPVKRFETVTWSLEDDMGVTTHAVVGGALRAMTVIRNYALTGPNAVRVDEAVVISGLVSLSG